jgi:hypothetical protein
MDAAEPYAADAPLGRVNEAAVARRVFDEFSDMGGAAGCLVEEGRPVGEEVAEGSVDPDAVSVPPDCCGDDAV